MDRQCTVVGKTPARQLCKRKSGDQGLAEAGHCDGGFSLSATWPGCVDLAPIPGVYRRMTSETLGCEIGGGERVVKEGGVGASMRDSDHPPATGVVTLPAAKKTLSRRCREDVKLSG